MTARYADSIALQMHRSHLSLGVRHPLADLAAAGGNEVRP